MKQSALSQFVIFAPLISQLVFAQTTGAKNVGLLVTASGLDSLVAHWPMNDGSGTTVTDIAGGNHGTMVGLDPAAAWLPDGGVRFDNIDGHHIEVPHADAIDFADESFTISMLIRYITPPAEEDTDRWIIKGTHAPPGTGKRYEMFHTGAPTLRFTLDDDRQKTRLEVTDEYLGIGVDWGHLVGVRDVVKDSIYVYENGILVGASYNYSSDISNGEPLWIGESTDEEGTAMSGDMKDIRLYNVALTSDEVTELFNTYGITVGVEDESSSMPIDHALMQNYPNPFNPSTKITYNLAKNTSVALNIYNMLGHHVTTLINGYQTAGQYHIVWDASDANGGVYFYTLKTGRSVVTKKMLLIK